MRKKYALILHHFPQFVAKSSLSHDCGVTLIILEYKMMLALHMTSLKLPGTELCLEDPLFMSSFMSFFR